MRVADWSNINVEHFDEGVYASNLWFGAEDGSQYPQRHLYAPPLTPWLIEWTMIVSGRVSGLVAIWPSLVAGLATIAAVWGLGWRLFGVAGGHAAAMLAALSGTHSLLSRTALTDSVLLLWFVLALASFDYGFQSLRWRYFIGSGVAVGLAWLTKYNGWLPLFLAAISLPVYLVASPLVRPNARRFLSGLCLSAVIAFAIWSPYLYSLQSKGGYAAVNANHRRYLVGWRGWPHSLTRQAANLGYIGGFGNADLLAIACGAIGTIQMLTKQLGQRSGRAMHQPAESENRAGTWLAITWYWSMAAMTPLYAPYPRLVLPFLAASWIGAAGMASGVSSWFVQRHRHAKPASTFAITGWQSQALLAILFILAGLSAHATGRVWDDRNGLAHIAERIQQMIAKTNAAENRSDTHVVYVYGEPALFFHLRAAGVAPVVPIQTVALTPGTEHGVPVPTYLVTGPHAIRDESFQSTWKANEARFDLVTAFPYRPSTLVLLDNYEPRELQGAGVLEHVRLYRIK